MSKAAIIGGKQIYTGRVVKTGENALPDPSGIYNKKLVAITADMETELIIKTGQTRDDGHIKWDYSPPTYYSGANGIECGGGTGKVIGSVVPFFRFPNITVPQGSTISSALFFVKNFGWNSGTVDGVIRWRIEDADDVATGTSNLYVMDDTIWNATLTTAYTDQALNGQDDLNVDITTTVQEVINRGGWSSGNAMRLQGRTVTANSAGVTGFKYYGDVDRGKLTITYV